MEIVFVHLNSRIPIHLYLNLIRTSNIFPNIQITLISNQSQLIPKGIKFKIFEKDQEWNELESRISHPRNFRKNFWLTSLGRLQLLAKYQTEIGKPILHIESDVIVSGDFPIKNFYDKVFHIAFPLISLERGIASILYIPNAESSSALLSAIRSESSKNSFTTDMLVLGKLKENFSKVIPLPIGPVDKSSYREFTPYKLIESWQRSMNVFGGVFDGWDLGGYFFGTDPRNARGRSFIQKQVPSEFANVINWELKFCENRNFINIITESGEIPVYCLHLTSKRINLFRKRLIGKKISKFLEHKKEYSIFNLRIFFTQFLLALIRRLKENNAFKS
jgi:hypothetical protein